jgi:hypothetical protein
MPLKLNQPQGNKNDLAKYLELEQEQEQEQEQERELELEREREPVISYY